MGAGSPPTGPSEGPIGGSHLKRSAPRREARERRRETPEAPEALSLPPLAPPRGPACVSVPPLQGSASLVPRGSPTGSISPPWPTRAGGGSAARLGLASCPPRRSRVASWVPRWSAAAHAGQRGWLSPSFWAPPRWSPEGRTFREGHEGRKGQDGGMGHNGRKGHDGGKGQTAGTNEAQPPLARPCIQSRGSLRVFNASAGYLTRAVDPTHPIPACLSPPPLGGFRGLGFGV